MKKQLSNPSLLAFAGRSVATYLTIWIRTLAERFDAAIFAPHVTLHAGPRIAGDSPERILRDTTRKYSRIVLRHEGIRHSDEFTKTVYVEFEETNEIIKLSEQLRQSYSHSSGYEFQPRLSLNLCVA